MVHQEAVGAIAVVVSAHAIEDARWRIDAAAGGEAIGHLAVGDQAADLQPVPPGHILEHGFGEGAGVHPLAAHQLLEVEIVQGVRHLVGHHQQRLAVRAAAAFQHSQALGTEARWQHHAGDERHLGGIAHIKHCQQALAGALLPHNRVGAVVEPGHHHPLGLGAFVVTAAVVIDAMGDRHRLQGVAAVPQQLAAGGVKQAGAAASEGGVRNGVEIRERLQTVTGSSAAEFVCVSAVVPAIALVGGEEVVLEAEAECGHAIRHAQAQHVVAEHRLDQRTRAGRVIAIGEIHELRGEINRPQGEDPLDHIAAQIHLRHCVVFLQRHVGVVAVDGYRLRLNIRALPRQPGLATEANARRQREPAEAKLVIAEARPAGGAADRDQADAAGPIHLRPVDGVVGGGLPLVGHHQLGARAVERQAIGQEAHAHIPQKGEPTIGRGAIEAHHTLPPLAGVVRRRQRHGHQAAERGHRLGRPGRLDGRNRCGRRAVTQALQQGGWCGGQAVGAGDLQRAATARGEGEALAVGHHHRGDLALEVFGGRRGLRERGGQVQGSLKGPCAGTASGRLAQQDVKPGAGGWHRHRKGDRVMTSSTRSPNNFCGVQRMD